MMSTFPRHISFGLDAAGSLAALMKLMFTFSEKFQSMNLAIIGKSPGVKYWLVSFWDALWALSIIELIMSSATSGMVTLTSLARVSLVSSQDSLFLV